MPPSKQSWPQDPTAPPDEYQQQVKSSIQALVSSQRPRDPVMSGASTGRLLLEGVVESLRIWRDFKEGERGREGGEGRSSRENRERNGGRETWGSMGGRDGRERRRRRRRSRERRGGECVREDGEGNRDQHQHQHRRRGSHSSGGEPSREAGQHVMSGTLQAAEQAVERILGPDGTPFGHLPSRGKGVRLLTHARTVYRHVKAEQDAGHRGKGYFEKHVDALFRKGKGMGEEEETLIERGGPRRDGGRIPRDGRRRQRRSGGRDEGVSRGTNGPVSAPVGEGGPSGVQKSPLASPASSRIDRPSPQPARLGQPLLGSAPPSRRKSHHVDTVVALILEQEAEATQSPVRVHSPASFVSATPSALDAPPIGKVDASEARGSRSTSPAPTIRVQSPTPPQEQPERSLTPSVRGVPSRVQSLEPEWWELAHPVRSPVPSQRAVSSLPMPTPAPAVATARSAAPAVVDVPVPVAPPAVPPPPPLCKPDRNALLASIQVGVKLKHLTEEDKKDASAARKDDARTGYTVSQTPVYEETPHSHSVEALEHTQAVEERERRQEEHLPRAKSPYIAPQPRMKLPINFQDELAAKSAKMRLNRRNNSGASEAGLGEVSNVVRPRASNETWRTVFSDNERYSEPDHAFREQLGNKLLGGGTPGPVTATTMPAVTTRREPTPAPDVFVDLAADIASPGWQSGPSWDFGSMGKGAD